MILVIRKFEKREVYSSFKDNICGADQADMQVISKYNKGIQFLLCVFIFLVNIHRLLLLRARKELRLLVMPK